MSVNKARVLGAEIPVPDQVAHVLELGPVVPPSNKGGGFTLNYSHPEYDTAADQLHWGRRPSTTSSIPEELTYQVAPDVKAVIEVNKPRGWLAAGKVAVAGFFLRSSDRKSTKLALRVAAATGEDPDPDHVGTQRTEDYYEKQKDRIRTNRNRRVQGIQNHKESVSNSSEISRRGRQIAIVHNNMLQNDAVMKLELRNLRDGFSTRIRKVNPDGSYEYFPLSSLASVHYDPVKRKMTSTFHEITPGHPRIAGRIKFLEAALGEEPMPGPAEANERTHPTNPIAPSDRIIPGRTNGYLNSGENRLQFNRPQESIDLINDLPSWAHRYFEARKLSEWLRLHSDHYKVGDEAARMASGDDRVGRKLMSKVNKKRGFARRLLISAGMENAADKVLR